MSLNAWIRSIYIGTYLTLAVAPSVASADIRSIECGMYKVDIHYSKPGVKDALPHRALVSVQQRTSTIGDIPSNVPQWSGSGNFILLERNATSTISMTCTNNGSGGNSSSQKCTPYTSGNGSTQPVSIVGTDKDDLIVCSSMQGCIVDSGAGNDIVCTGSGPDTVTAGEGNDFIFTGMGPDVAQGNAGNDYVVGGAGGDLIQCGKGYDLCVGGVPKNFPGSPYYDARDDNDVIHGGADTDKCFGSAGRDTIYGGAGDLDEVNGGDDEDSLSGGDGAQDLCDGGQAGCPRTATTLDTSCERIKNIFRPSYCK